MLACSGELKYSWTRRVGWGFVAGLGKAHCTRGRRDL